MTTIRKAIITSLSLSPDPSNLIVAEATLPPPSANEAQVRVLYAGFNGADVNMSRGTYPMQRSAPLTPGYCLVGIVEIPPRTGSGGFRAGDTVIAVTTYDAQAERANVAERLLIKVPAALAGRDAALQQAAAIALDWNTAWGMVAQAAGVQAGQRVFVHGLSGAVGQGLVALCLLRGAEVYGTASARNHEALHAQGVREVWDYRDKKWVEAVRELGGMDVVFDPLGFESWDESWGALRNGGILVGYGQNQGSLAGDQVARSPWWYIAKLLARAVVPFTGKRATFYYIRPGSKACREGAEELMNMLAAGEIKVPIKAVWNLTTEGIREAHQSWGKMPGMGSLLIRTGAEKPA